MPSEALALLPNLSQQEVTEEFLASTSRFAEQPRFLMPQTAQGLGKQALLGANVLLASNFPAALDQARSRNQTIIADVAASKNKLAGAAEKVATGTTLHERLDLSATGNKEARAAVDIDAFTELIEQMCKAGAVLKVQTKLTPAGEVEQFGQTTETRQRNTLSTYALNTSALRDTIYAEGQNGFFIEEAHKQGLLKGKRVVEFSLIPDDTHQALAKHGYYLREVIGVLRVTTIAKNGDCEIVSVLVGGTDQAKLPPLKKIKTEQAEIAAEKQALSNRFDIATVRSVYAKLGRKNALQLSTDQLLGEPVIIDDAYDHLDIAMLFDDIASQIASKTLFYGLPYSGKTKPNRATYQAHEAASLAFQSKLKSVAQVVANEAVQRRYEAKTNGQTARLFRDIAKNHAVSYLVTDKTADTTVFGAQTFHLVAKARKHYEAGDHVAAQQFTAQAQKKAKATGCPGDETKKENSVMDSIKSILRKAINKLTGREENEEDEEIPDNIRCIKCEKISPKEEVIQEEKDTWYCPCCHYEINVCSGEVVHPSDIDA